MGFIKMLPSKLELVILLLFATSCQEYLPNEELFVESPVSENQINGHTFVDLGLPSGVLWARCNVGAATPEDFGDYYAWGEIEVKNSYDHGNNTTYDLNLGDITGNPEYDVARAKWGADWRMPTEDECNELFENCTTEYIVQNGVYGYLIIGKGGNSIFLPSSGFRSGSSIYEAQYDYSSLFGYYWSSTPSGGVLGSSAYCLGSVLDEYRDRGHTIRPVCDGKNGDYLPDGDINGHDYVDLGLSVKWATCNMGATKPEKFGDYYAWGETEEKEKYYWGTYKWCNGSETTLTKYCTDSSYGIIDNKILLEPEDDVAYVKWGSYWHIPTKEEFDELQEKCDWQCTALHGIRGYKVTSKTNGKSIFLPAAGDYEYNTSNNAGRYWTSSLYTSDKAYYANFYIDFASCDIDKYSRYDGFSIRPVCK